MSKPATITFAARLMVRLMLSSVQALTTTRLLSLTSVVYISTLSLFLVAILLHQSAHSQYLQNLAQQEAQSTLALHSLTQEIEYWEKVTQSTQSAQVWQRLQSLYLATKMSTDAARAAHQQFSLHPTNTTAPTN